MGHFSAETWHSPGQLSAEINISHLGRKDQAMAAELWPTDGYFANYHEFQILGVLSNVLQLRMIDEFREKQGVTYSPGASRTASKIFPGEGYEVAGIEAPADKLPAFFADVDAIAKALRETPPTQDEFDRAARPQIEQVEHLRATNDYWLGALAGAQTDPRKLDVIREAVSGLKSVTPADVQHVAAKYLRSEAALRVMVVPAPSVPSAK